MKYQNTFNGVIAFCALAALILSIINAISQYRENRVKHEVIFTPLVQMDGYSDSIKVSIVFKNTGNRTELLTGAYLTSPGEITPDSRLWFDFNEETREKVNEFFPLILSPNEIRRIELFIPLTSLTKEEDEYHEPRMDFDLNLEISYLALDGSFQSTDIYHIASFGTDAPNPSLLEVIRYIEPQKIDFSVVYSENIDKVMYFLNREYINEEEAN